MSSLKISPITSHYTTYVNILQHFLLVIVLPKRENIFINKKGEQMIRRETLSTHVRKNGSGPEMIIDFKPPLGEDDATKLIVVEPRLVVATPEGVSRVIFDGDSFPGEVLGFIATSEAIAQVSGRHYSNWARPFVPCLKVG